MNTKEHLLEQAMPLFAMQGYAGVSMRDLAKSADVGVSGIYHHFPDKKTLYLETVQLAFSNQAIAFSEVWKSESSDENKIRQFVACLTEMMQADRNFHRLMQRELLEADQDRVKLLAEGVFKEQFSELMKVIKRLVPDYDPHLTAVSVIGLVCNHLEMQPMRCFLPGYKPEHENTQVIAAHITNLLLHGFRF